MIIFNTEKGTKRKFTDMDQLIKHYFTMSTEEKLVSIVKADNKVMDFAGFMIYLLEM